MQGVVRSVVVAFGVILFCPSIASADRDIVLVRDIKPGPDHSSPTGLFDLDGTLFFQARTLEHGQELWRSDGTGAGTELVIDLWPGPDPPFLGSPTFGVLDRFLFFGGDDGLVGREPWKTDGSAAGT